jgi:16S rRNA (cytosine967-C5)-methyltransferase
MALERGRGHSDELLRGTGVETLEQADRNLATALVLGVLRWQIRLDEETKLFLKRPGARLDPEVRVALRMGTFQLLFLDRVPAHAAIDESVELAKRAGHRFAAGMVNAVLRKLAAQDGEEQGYSHPASVAELARAYAHPAWMVDRWVRVYGLEAARGICECGQRQASPTVRLNDAAVETELVHAGVGLGSGKLLDKARTAVAGDVTATVPFREGRVRLQDEGSQLIGEIAACPCEVGGRRVEKILDLCAAPGGKTLILAERNPQARIVACEASAARLASLRERLAGYTDRVECRLEDAAARDEEGVFDLALADVPCSGTGTLGRNPEIRHRLREEDLAQQAERQRAILRAALRAVRPGGRVVYSTCSLEAEENEQVVGAVLAENAAARIIPMGDCIDALEGAGVPAAGAAERLRECITPAGALRLLPGVFETDGFFAAVMERSA